MSARKFSKQHLLSEKTFLNIYGDRTKKQIEKMPKIRHFEINSFSSTSINNDILLTNFRMHRAIVTIAAEKLSAVRRVGRSRDQHTGECLLS